jgi:hypothetical protein
MAKPKPGLIEICQFGDALIAIGDLDPAYIALVGAPSCLSLSSVGCYSPMCSSTTWASRLGYAGRRPKREAVAAGRALTVGILVAYLPSSKRRRK